MAQATHRKADLGGITLELSMREAINLKQALIASSGQEGVLKALMDLLGGPPVTAEVRPVRRFSRVRMLKDCGRWIGAGEEGVVTNIEFNPVTPEEDTQFTVAFAPGRYQVMTRECFEVLPNQYLVL